MMRRLNIAFLLLLFPLLSFSQNEKGEAVPIVRQEVDSVRAEAINGSYQRASAPIEYDGAHQADTEALFPYHLARPMNVGLARVRFTPGVAPLHGWGSGVMIATGGSQLMPGMMQMDYGAIGAYQSVGDFTIYAGASASKYGYFQGVHTQYGFNASVSYRINPNLSATLFGDVYFGRPPLMANGMAMPPSMIGYYNRTKYGGYFDFSISERWGARVGMQSMQQFGTHRQRLEPILNPYFKISKKVEIEIPAGQILYEILRNL